MDYFGAVVNCSARVSDAGHGGQIMITQEICDFLRVDENQASAELKAFGPVITVRSIDVAVHLQVCRALWD